MNLREKAEMSTRPRRMPNFTTPEENVLKMLTIKYKEAIEEKGLNVATRKRKNQAWEQIAKEFYDNTKIERTPLKLKSKYDSMKKSKKLHFVGGVKQEVIESVDEAVTEQTEAPKTSDPPPEPHAEPELKIKLSPPRLLRHFSRESVSSPVLMIDIPPEEEPLMSPKVVPKEEKQSPPDTDVENDENKNVQLLYENRSKRVDVIFYRNKEMREREKHLAKLTNLEIRRKILEMELKIKEREFNTNTNTNMCTD